MTEETKRATPLIFSLTNSTAVPNMTTAKLSALGFCGADDTVNPRHLALIAHKYPHVEWCVVHG